MIQSKIPAPSGVFRPQEIARVCGGRVIRSGAIAQRVVTDSRELEVGDCFVALHGPNFDGHGFLGDVFTRGVAGVVVSADVPMRLLPSGVFVVRVLDTHKALLDLAFAHRREMSAKVVGITGSCGKTSTKDMLAHVLSARMSVVASPMSYNNHVGVPLTLFQMQHSTQAAVVEIGSNAPGEVAMLAKVADSDIGIVTCVREAHLEGFGNLGGVAREKMCLIESLSADGVALLNGDDHACRAMAEHTSARTMLVSVVDESADWFATNIQHHGLGMTFLLRGKRPVTLPRMGSHNVHNALFTIAAAVELGMDEDSVLEMLYCLPATRRRLEPKDAGGVTVLDDSYNMNPASARAALHALAGWQGKGLRIAVFGEMLELGGSSAALHEDLGRAAAETDVDYLVAVGKGAAPLAEGALAAGMSEAKVVCADDSQAALVRLLEIVGAGDCVLCKASRQIGLDRLVDNLISHLGAPSTST